ncbi:MAG: DUF6786 family protein [Planctomycetota bacterium]
MRGVAMAVTLGLLVTGAAAQDKAGTFGDDLAFLKLHGQPVVLKDAAGQAQIIVMPGLQGRVMTSTASGLDGLSFGWINRALFEKGKPVEHFNAWGGEDRLWLGPEGGQFSIYFAKGKSFVFDNWYVPAAIDTEPFEVVSQAPHAIVCRRKFDLTNYSGTKFHVQIDRTVRLLEAGQAWQQLGVPAPADARLVAYESESTLNNAGQEPWKKDTGLLSIWILSMYNPSPATTVVIPIKTGPESELGPPVNADYFGRVPPERLVVKDGVVFFSADGKYRSKIGISPRRAKPLLASYDADNHVLTFVQYTLPEGAVDYVNSMWEIQKNPYGGDAANSYNDGPVDGGEPLGPFYELESSSPAAALAPGAKLTHVHRTFHIQGAEPELNKLAQALLGVSLEQITSALPRPK